MYLRVLTEEKVMVGGLEKLENCEVGNRKIRHVGLVQLSPYTLTEEKEKLTEGSTCAVDGLNGSRFDGWGLARLPETRSKTDQLRT